MLCNIHEAYFSLSQSMTTDYSLSMINETLSHRNPPDSVLTWWLNDAWITTILCVNETIIYLEGLLCGWTSFMGHGPVIWRAQLISPTLTHHLVKVSIFQKQILLFSFEPKKWTKLFFDFCPKELKWVKSKNKGLYFIQHPPN